MENRNYAFNSKEIHMDRVEEVLRYASSKLNFAEICKMFREICYDQVCYWNEESCGVIYKDGREKLATEQACRLQRKVSTAVDLFTQSICDKRVFDESYLEERLGK